MNSNDVKQRRNRGLPGAAIALAAMLFAAFAAAPTAAQPATFADGGVFIGMSNGTVIWYEPDGTQVDTLVSLSDGPVHQVAFTQGLDMYVPHFYDGAAGGNTVAVFNHEATLIGIFGSGYNCNPATIELYGVDDAAWIGETDCLGGLLQFDGDGNLVLRRAPAVEVRGVHFLDFADDLCTIHYTSFGLNVKRYDVCTESQLPDFNVAPLPDAGGAQALAILPDGGVLVANLSVIVRLDAAGNQIGTYDDAGRDLWIGLALDPDGTSFWATDWQTSYVYRFDLASGAVLTSWDVGTEPFTVKGVTVQPPTDLPPPPRAAARMTGGGSVFTESIDPELGEIRVTHGFELHCDPAAVPNNLQINWEKGNRFHLEELLTAECFDDPEINPHPPTAPFDTYVGTGTGRYNGEPGATAEWTFTDAGEPGTVDQIVSLVIRDAGGSVVLTVEEEFLTFGNHQAHKAKPGAGLRRGGGRVSGSSTD
jgi:hypothetical protein